jgi:oligopeptide transport system substrate-binding protein
MASEQKRTLRAVWAYAVTALALALLPSCFTNDPYPSSEAGKPIYYDTFREEPKHLDPAVAYSADSYTFTNQIYEPVIQYHYLKRPYTLVPLTAERMPDVKLYDKQGKQLSDDAPADDVAKAVYEITLRADVRYQDHPSFVRGADGQYLWHLAPGASFPKIDHPDELLKAPGGAPGTATRAARAEDYVYEIKRLAHPKLECPIASLFATCLDGFADFQKKLNEELERIRGERRKAAGVLYNQEADERANPIWLDLRRYELPGAQVVDERTLRITLTRKYPQFLYWLAMPFFSPVPWEVDRFYQQAAAAEQNLSLDRFPVGTGPFVLAVNQPNYRMVLRRNPNYHEEKYPTEGEAEDEAKGLLEDRGRPLPFLDEAVYVLEREGVPRWNKFLQGYYDTSGIGSDLFDQAVQFNNVGVPGLTDDLRERSIRLESVVAAATYYYAYNMQDEVVGGLDEKRRKLRQALSIAFNVEEQIQIFENGQGVAAQSPIPPGVFGYQEGREGVNPVVYEWDAAGSRPKRKSLEVAKQLLAEAGYPNGRNAEGQPLIIFYDTTAAGPGSKAYLDWMRKQFDPIGVELQVRATDYNRFQEKALQGNFEMLSWGWLADYPDPENFLFLLYGKNAKAKTQGENAANYDQARFNELFRQMENMTNSPRRAELIREMLKIAREDAPWIWGYHPVEYGLYHAWYRNAKPMLFGGNTLKYKRVDPVLREQCRKEWNRPISWPLWATLALLILGTIPAAVVVYRRERGVPGA